MATLTGNLIVLTFDSIGSKIVYLVRICFPRFDGMTALTITPFLTRVNIFVTPFTVCWRTAINIVHMTLTAVDILVAPQQCVLGHLIVLEVFDR